MKWIVFVAVFDLLSLLLRLGGDLLLGRDVAGAAARKMRALIDSGLSPEQAALAMGNQPVGAMRFAPAPSIEEAAQAFALRAKYEQSAHKPAHSSNTRIAYKNHERVPAHLSQTAGKGRVGKVDVCKDCGVDYVVPAYNATRCTSCASEARASYRKAKARRKA